MDIFPSDNCNVIFGPNGSGKTNLLDIIHCSAMSKSYFPISDKMTIRMDSEFTRIEAEYSEIKNDRILRLSLSVPREGRKKIKKDGDLLKKSIDLLGLVPIVTIVPDDVELIKASSDVRRRFMDRILCQLHTEYTNALINYQRVLKQKMALLKATPHFIQLDRSLIAAYDKVLSHEGSILFRHRSEFAGSFLPLFLDLYHQIAEKKESVGVTYKSNFNQISYSSDVEKSLEKDYYTKRVSVGIHRDDLIFDISGQLIRRFGSQGQIKTYIYALKLSEYVFLDKGGESRPILLLDDVFEKLDLERLQKLLELINSDQFGQIFITDTELERSKLLLDKLKVPFSSFYVIDNTIKPQDG